MSDSPPRWSVSPPSLSPLKSPLHPFLVRKALKTGNSEKCVFRVLRLFCCPGPQIRSFSAENLLQVFAVLRNPFSSPKNLEFQPAELVTAEVTGL